MTEQTFDARLIAHDGNGVPIDEIADLSDVARREHKAIMRAFDRSQASLIEIKAFEC